LWVLEYESSVHKNTPEVEFNSGHILGQAINSCWKNPTLESMNVFYCIDLYEYFFIDALLTIRIASNTHLYEFLKIIVLIS
jgi:hypothetical protein